MAEVCTLDKFDVLKNRSWRPFQLAFLLLSIPSLADPSHPDRVQPVEAYADLLWFPTGGGKTEAYLGVAAFTMAIRRMQGNLGGYDSSRGLAVIMRYTLRLLTLQQFQRATALICAMEVLRRDALDKGDKAPKSKAATFLSENFSAIFSLEETDQVEPAEVLSKISLLPAVRYIGQERDAFTDAARTAVFKYSEIDLNYFETKELANGLVDLVFRKAASTLAGVQPEDIPKRVGVQLDDLLEVLSISRSVYEALLAGEDQRVLKTASVIQRWYKQAGADEQMIDYAAQQKVISSAAYAAA